MEWFRQGHKPTNGVLLDMGSTPIISTNTRVYLLVKGAVCKTANREFDSHRTLHGLVI